MTKGETYQHTFASNTISEVILLSPKTSNNAFVFPLYIFPSEQEINSGLYNRDDRQINLNSLFIKAFQEKLGVVFIDTFNNDNARTFPICIFEYIYAILHSPSYRARYAEFLKIDFPRLPLTSSLELFKKLSRLGEELVSLHLMGSPELNKFITTWQGYPVSNEVEKVTYSDGAVWVDKAQSTGFLGVPENVWNFHIGGYQVCEKWLKDRKGRALSVADIDHYQKIVVALNETIRLMKEIDEFIDQHGSWPGAFQ